MLDMLQKIYNSVAGREDIILSTSMKLEDLQLSSLGLIQLVCEIEDTFDIEISNKELRSFKKVKHVVDFLEKKQKGIG